MHILMCMCMLPLTFLKNARGIRNLCALKNWLLLRMIYGMSNGVCGIYLGSERAFVNV